MNEDQKRKEKSHQTLKAILYWMNGEHLNNRRELNIQHLLWNHWTEARLHI